MENGKWKGKGMDRVGEWGGKREVKERRLLTLTFLPVRCSSAAIECLMCGETECTEEYLCAE